MKEQLSAQLEAVLLLFDFARKIIPHHPPPPFFFLHSLFPFSVNHRRNKRNSGFLKSFTLVCWILSCKWLTVHLKSEEAL